MPVFYILYPSRALLQRPLQIRCRFVRFISPVYISNEVAKITNLDRDELYNEPGFILRAHELLIYIGCDICSDFEYARYNSTASRCLPNDMQGRTQFKRTASWILYLVPNTSGAMMWNAFVPLHLHLLDCVIQQEINEYSIDL